MEPKEYMMQALELARQALDTGDVPVGCVVVQGDQVVGRGRNRREEKQNALLHAEIEAINEACQTLGRWRLSDCALYVTLEPCPMCNPASLRCFSGPGTPKEEPWEACWTCSGRISTTVPRWWPVCWRRNAPACWKNFSAHCGKADKKAERTTSSPLLLFQLI